MMKPIKIYKKNKFKKVKHPFVIWRLSSTIHIYSLKIKKMPEVLNFTLVPLIFLPFIISPTEDWYINSGTSM
jgi:hypothetical protein